jgi:uncharacterized delta-60 repeat protein
MALQNDGRIVIGGQFYTVDGQAHTNIARLQPDGSLDTNFAVQITRSTSVGQIKALAIQTNGRILAGGMFDSVNGMARKGMVRFNADGSLDSGFNPLFGQIPTVEAIALLPNGQILIAGSFTLGQVDARRSVARLNENGTVDLSFNVGSVSGFPYGLLVQTNGQILIRGFFSAVGGISRSNIARLNSNGTVDSNFAPRLNAFASVTSMALQPDGKVLITGTFTNVNGVPRNGAARLLTNGMLDTTFSLTNGSERVFSNGGWLDFVTIDSSGRIFLNGGFNADDLSGYYGLARFNPDGSLDSAFKPMKSIISNLKVNRAIFLNDGKILLGGEFGDVFGVQRGGIARIHAEGSATVRLQIQSNPGYATISWSPTTPGFVLQVSDSLATPTWTDAASGSANPVSVPLMGTAKFFRLRPQ